MFRKRCQHADSCPDADRLSNMIVRISAREKMMISGREMKMNFQPRLPKALLKKGARVYRIVDGNLTSENTKDGPFESGRGQSVRNAGRFRQFGNSGASPSTKGELNRLF